MKAAVWHGKLDVRVEEIQEPLEPRGEDVVVEVCCTGICGTDVHEYLAGPIFIPPALKQVVLGHEFSARVIAIGEGVTKAKVGDRVAVIPHRVCRSCYFCRRGMFQHCRQLELVGITRHGGFTRYTVARQDQLVALPDTISDEVGALVEPLAVTLRAMQLPGVRVGDDAAIVGAGPIGLCAVATARAAGVRNVFVIEKLRGRAALARKLGASAVVDPQLEDPVEAIHDLTGGRGVDLALECVGILPTMNLSIELVRPGGLAVIIGVAEKAGELNLHKAVSTEKEVRGCIGYFEGEWQSVVGLIASGRLDPTPLVTDRIEVEEIVDKGFEALIHNKDSCVKVLVHPSKED
jgi:(R,R)-butanediol dehydrogenase / meso-butanediol dehydrogenase / diacetyl reductase